MSVNQQKVKERIEGREIAKTILALAKQELSGKSVHVVAGFYQELRAAADHHLPVTDQFDAMTDAEARQLEDERIAFGQYAGDKHAQVQFSYLALFIRTGIRYLRYARSDRAKRRSDWEHTF